MVESSTRAAFVAVFLPLAVAGAALAPPLPPPSTLIKFSDAARSPVGGLTEAFGFLYGVTQSGGNGTGVMYKISPNDPSNIQFIGSLPQQQGRAQGRLVLVNNALYGTTQGGGTFGRGTVFKFDLTTGALSTFASFGSPAATGANPIAGLIASNGFL